MALYPLLDQAHFWLSRLILLVAVVMFALAIYIGLVRRGDVSRIFRLGVYLVTGIVLLEALIGLVMYFMGGRPYEEVHLVYGLGSLLALPFFIFVETTAKKRPAMGSYMWGFALLAGVVIRSILTGAAG
jgi:heme A synthase